MVKRERWDRRLPMPLPVSNGVCDRIGKLTTRPPQYRNGNADGQAGWKFQRFNVLKSRSARFEP